MENIERIIFVDKSGTLQAPMAAGIMQEEIGQKKYEILSRGLQVQFSEPMNPKAKAVMLGNDIKAEFVSVQIVSEDITENTLVLTMEDKQKTYLLKHMEKATDTNTFCLTSYVGEELAILDPYGGSIQAYGLCFENIKAVILKLIEKITEERL